MSLSCFFNLAITFFCLSHILYVECVCLLSILLCHSKITYIYFHKSEDYVMYGYHSRCLLHSSLKSADLWVQCFLAFSMLPLLLRGFLFHISICMQYVCVSIIVLQHSTITYIYFHKSKDYVIYGSQKHCLKTNIEAITNQDKGHLIMCGNSDDACNSDVVAMTDQDHRHISLEETPSSMLTLPAPTADLSNHIYPGFTYKYKVSTTIS